MVVLFSCENEMSVIHSLTKVDSLPSESAQNIRLHYTDSGFLKIVLESPELLKFSGDNPYIEFPKGIHVFFYDSVDALTTDIQSDYAISYEKKELMEVRKNVIITNHKEETVLTTEILFWDQKKHIIYNNVFTTVKENDRIMHGDSMMADENMNQFNLYQMRATIDLIEDDSIN